MELYEQKTLCQIIADVFVHKTVFHFFIPRVFPVVSAWFLPSCLYWSGKYSNSVEYTIQPLDRLDLRFSI